MTQLEAPEDKRRIRTVALLVFIALASEPVAVLLLDRAIAGLAALALIVLAIILRNRPPLFAVAIIAGAILLRLTYPSEAVTDQIRVTQAAALRALDGLNPYGVGYANSVPPGSAMPYGPLALLWWLPGPVVEFAAAIGLMALLARHRAWITLAVVAAWFPAINFQFSGVNDYSPALLITLAAVLIEHHPRRAMAILAMATALKPYAAAWLLPFVGVAGWSGAAVFVGISAALWSPVLLGWGLESYLTSIRMTGFGGGIVRWLAVPVALAGLRFRRWDEAVIVGAVVFAVFLFADATVAYWFAVIPPLGLALESRWVPELVRRVASVVVRDDARPAGEVGHDRAVETAPAVVVDPAAGHVR